MHNDSLVRLGWSDSFADAFARLPQLFDPYRVVAAHRDALQLSDGSATRRARVAGRLHHVAASPVDLPAVGDWVGAMARSQTDDAVVHHVLPRRSALIRAAAGRATAAQVLAANVDAVFVTTSLNQDLNLRRLERVLAIVWESGAQPIVLLTKSDLCADAADAVDRVSTVAPGVPVHAVSALLGHGLDDVARYVTPGRTVALIGTSGVGKSTVVNRLFGADILAVRDVREHDDRGMHTTTHRELVQLPQGGNLIDTPGMREFLQWDAESGLDAAFSDVQEVAAGCRFTDCRHDGEPGCAVLDAIDEGSLDASRLDNLRKLERELAHLERKQDVHARREERKKWAAIHKSLRQHPKKRW